MINLIINYILYSDIITPYMKCKEYNDGSIANEEDQCLSVWLGGLVIYEKIQETQMTEEQRNMFIWYEEFE